MKRFHAGSGKLGPLLRCLAAAVGVAVFAPTDAPGRGGGAAGPDSGTVLELSSAERAWLAEHRTIRVAFDGYFPPYSVLGADGAVEGLAVDVFGEISRRVGIGIEISPKMVWKELYAAAQNRDVDVVATMGQRPERERWFAFTRPYIFKSLAIMTRSDNGGISRPEDLAGKRVALVRDYQYVKPLLEKHPSVEPLYVDTMLDGLNAVAVGKADAAIVFVGAGHYLKTKYQLANLTFAGIYDRDRFTDSVAVRKDWPELAAILDKALGSISVAQMQALQSKWLPGQDLSARVALTAAEREWIRSHPVIRVGIDPEFAPFEFRDGDGRHVGISADYLDLLSRRLGIEFAVEPGLTWTQVMERARNGQIDLLPCVGRTAEREGYLDYSDSYFNSRLVVVTRADAPFIEGLESIGGWRIGVQADSSSEGYLKEHTTIEPARFSTVQQALVALSGGTVDAVVDNIGSSAHWVRALGITNLKIAAPVSEEKLHVAVRKDWPTLSGIVDKGLATVREEERNRIGQKWIAVEYKPGVAPGTVWRYSLGVAGAVLLLIAGFAAWNRTLKSQVRGRTAQLRAELAQRARAEDSLRESEERFRATFEQAAVGIAHVAPDGRWLRVNEKLCGIVGYTREELLERTFQQITVEEDLAHDLEILRQVLARDRAAYSMEKRYIRKDGAVVWINLTVSLVRTPAGAPKYFIAVVEEIGERKRAQETLQRNEQVLRLFVEHSPAAIAMFDRQMRYLVASRRFLADYSLGEQDLVGRSHYEVFPEIPERWKQIHRRCLAGAVEKSDEEPFARADGTTDWVRWEIRPWREPNGEIGGVILFSEVVTEQRKTRFELEMHRDHLEELVEQRTRDLDRSHRALQHLLEDVNEANEKLKQLDRLKSLFIASMSHELRTPLNSIIGFTGILLQGMAGPLNEEQRRQLGMVKGSSQHLMSLITDIIDLGKIEAGKIDLAIERFDLAAAAREVLASFGPAAESRGLALQIDAPPQMPVTSDPRRVRQVLVNLVGNAVKFTERGSVAVAVRLSDGAATVAVRDTGPGIRPKDMDKLFRPFSQIVAGELQKREGTGLGLYLSKKLVALLGGEISAHSEFGAGSEFSFRLPSGAGEEEG